MVLKRESTLPPVHLVLTFTSASPITPLPDGPYILRITGVPVVMSPPLRLTTPLGNVPTQVPVPPPATYLVRSTGNAPFTYTLVTTANLRSVVVRITGPDGAFVEKTV